MNIVFLRAVKEALEVSLSELFLKEEDPQLTESEAASLITKATDQLHIQIGEYPITYQTKTNR